MMTNDQTNNHDYKMAGDSGGVSLFDLNGVWTIQQIRNLMPPPKRGGSFNEILLRGSISTSSVKTYSSLPE